MKQLSVNSTQLCIGIDLGDKHSQVCVLDPATGELVEESRMRTRPEDFSRRFDGMERARIAIEVGSHSPWVGRELEKVGHEVVVANPHKLRLIYENQSKSDRVDAEYLARLAAADPKLLHPIQHRKEEVQVDRGMLKARDRAVECRTKLINCVRGLCKSLGRRLPRCDAEVFHKKARMEISEELEPVVKGVFEVLETLGRVIGAYDKEIERLCSEVYPETARLRQVKGVGPITALDFVLTLEDPTRFSTSRAVGSFLGLRPSRKSSGMRDPELAITKAGDRMLRRHLVNSAHYILGPFGPDCDLRRWGLKLAARGDQLAKKRAIVAVARKLAVLLHRLWISGQAYEPLRNARRAEASAS